MVHNQDPDSVGHCQRNPDDEGNPEFLKYYFENIPELNLIQRNSPNNQCSTLGSAVSAGIHQHRYKRKRAEG